MLGTRRVALLDSAHQAAQIETTPAHAVGEQKSGVLLATPNLRVLPAHRVARREEALPRAKRCRRANDRASWHAPCSGRPAAWRQPTSGSSPRRSRSMRRLAPNDPAAARDDVDEARSALDFVVNESPALCSAGRTPAARHAYSMREAPRVMRPPLRR
jgi:hypothetical protein